MVRTTDFQTDESDDIVINGDFSLEPDMVVSIVKTAERRVSARQDDFLLRNAGAGIESFLFKRITDTAKQMISSKINSVLSMDNLLNSQEFKIFILNHNDQGKLPVLIKFNFPGAEAKYNFQTLINQQNQRSYN